MDNVARRVSSNFFWLFTRDIIFRSAVFFGTLYIARVLGTAEFGLFSFAMAVSYSISIVVDLGVSLYGTREVARSLDKTKELLSVLNSLRFLASILTFSALFLVLTLAHVPPHKKSVLLAAGLYIIAYALSPDWLLRGTETMKYLSIGNLMMAFTFLPSIFFLVKDPGDTTWAALLWSLSSFFGSVAMIYLLWKKLGIKFFFTFSLSKWKEHFKELIYFTLIGLLTRAYIYLPVLLLGFLVTPKEVGIFSASHRFYLLITVNFALPRAFYPVLASLHQDIEAFKKAQYNFQKIMIAIGLPLGVGGTVLAKDIIGLLYGNSYLEGADVLKIIIWAVSITFIRMTYGQSLLVLGLQRFHALATGMGILITFILYLLLIPIYGIYGAALGMTFGEITILFIMAIAFSKRVYKSNPFDIYFLKVCIVCAFMGVVIKTVDVNIVIRLILGVLSYGILAMVLGIMNRKDILGFYSNIISNRKKE